MANKHLKEALEYLKDANYAKYFAEIDKLNLPDSLKYDYANHKRMFISGKYPSNFHQMLEVFVKEVERTYKKRIVYKFMEKYSYYILILLSVLILTVLPQLYPYIFKQKQDKFKSASKIHFNTVDANEKIKLIYFSKKNNSLDTFEISYNEKVYVLKDAIKKAYEVKPDSRKSLNYDYVSERLLSDNEYLSDSLTIMEAGVKNLDIIQYVFEYRMLTIDSGPMTKYMSLLKIFYSRIQL